MARKKSAASADSMDIGKAIRMCLDSGKTELGFAQTMDGAKLGHGKLVVIAKNMPKQEADDMQRYCAISKIPLLVYGGTSMELGSVCGKPFPVSAMLILEAGNSPIMGFVQK